VRGVHNINSMGIALLVLHDVLQVRGLILG
jgi:hypothetical protein